MDNQQALFTAFKENFDTQYNLMSALGRTVFAGLEKLIELNIGTTQATVIESGAAIKQYLSTEPKQWLSLAVIHCQPTAGKAFGYLHHASKIVSESQAEFNKTAELQIAATNSRIMTVVDAPASSTPAASAGTAAHPKAQTGKAGSRSGQPTAA